MTAQQALDFTPTPETNATPVPVESGVTFASFDLPAVLSQALVRMKYEHPTPVQARAIPAALEGKDVLGSAQTGTGKTGAFSIPMIARLMENPESCALVLTPTRELATQILTVVQQLLAGNRDIRTALLIGGDSMAKQFDQLRARPRLIIGTPGRINDHLRRNAALFQKTNMVVLDEADRMLDMGFSIQIDSILEECQDGRQTLMFSATFPDSILKFARKYMNNPERVSVNPAQVSAANIKHEILHTIEAEKYDNLCQQLDRREGSIIVFVKTKHGADRLAGKLERENHNAGVIHGGLKQRQRDRAIQSFRSKKTRIMVATDVAARGLDVPHIEHVINYDLPQNPEDYVHRIGRTARAGAEGEAIAFVSPSEKGKWAAIHRILNPNEKPQRGPKAEGDQNPYAKKRPFKGGYAAQGAERRTERSGNFRAGYGNREDRGERSERPFGERGFDKPQGQRPYGKTSERPFNKSGERPFVKSGERSYTKPEGERSFKPRNDRPQGDRPYADRPRADRAFGDRPRQDRPRNDRPQREADGNRRDAHRGHSDMVTSDDRARATLRTSGERMDGNRNPGQRGQRAEFRHDAPRGDRPEGRSSQRGFDQPRGGQSRGDQSRGDQSRGERSFNARPEGDRPFKPRSDRPFSDRPQGDRPRSDRPFADRPRGDRPQGERGTRSDRAGKPGGFARKDGAFKPKSGGKPGGFKKRDF